MKTKRAWSLPPSPFTSIDYAILNDCGIQESRHRLKTLLDHGVLDKESCSLYTMYTIKPAGNGNQVPQESKS